MADNPGVGPLITEKCVYQDLGTVRRNVVFLAAVWPGDFRRYEVGKFFKVPGHQGRAGARATLLLW